MNLDQHVSQLLFRYPCVVVPGFGGFLTEIKSAELNENTNSFSPPKKLVSFNANLQNNDGLIANHISVTDNISYGNAIRFIDSEVALWKKNLEENKTINIKKIGSFSLNNELKLVFVPSNDLNYLSNSFGLNTFVSPFIKRELEKKVFEFEHKVEEPTEEIEITHDEQSRKIPSYFKYAAVLMVSAGIAGTFGYKIYKENVNKNQLLVELEVQKKIESKIQQATFFISNPLSEISTTTKPALNYHVIAGAFKMQKNAKKACDDLISKGFEAKILAANKFGLIPVLYQSFGSHDEAILGMRKIQKSTNPDAWILIEELK